MDSRSKQFPCICRPQGTARPVGEQPGNRILDIVLCDDAVVHNSSSMRLAIVGNQHPGKENLDEYIAWWSS